LLLVLFLVTGCGKGGPKNSVSGKVLFKDQPVMGSVTFVGPDGKEVSGPINPDGTYTVNDPPLGEDKIAIKGIPGMVNAPPPPQGELPGMKGMPAPPKMAVPPPAKYANPANGLTFKVTGGKQTYNIDLNP